MRVLFITHYGGFYGANKSLYTLMLLLRERYGVQPTVLLPKEGPMCAQLARACIPYKVSHYYWWVNDNHGVFQWGLNRFKQIRNRLRVRKLCQLCSGYSPELIYTNSVCVNIGVWMSKAMGIPHVWQYREAFGQVGLKLSLSTWRSKAIWGDESTKKHILISDFMMRYYQQYLPQDKMVRVYNGVDLPEGVSERMSNSITGRLKIACIGIISSQKNQMELLRAQEILKDRGVEIETYFFGYAREAYYDQVWQFIIEHHLEETAHIVGHTNDVFGALREKNLGVVCARDEAFGRTTVEFMLMHMPVVVSDSGANAELIRSGETGAVYPLGSVAKLADAIENYVRHPELLQTQGDEAAKVAKRNFSAEKNAEQIYRVIKSAVNSEK